MTALVFLIQMSFIEVSGRLKPFVSIPQLTCLILAPDTMHKESMTNQWFFLKINIFQTVWETFTHKIRSENKSDNEISITLSGRLI